MQIWPDPDTLALVNDFLRANPTDFDPSTWETNNYRIFDPADMPNGTIDIPVWAQVRKPHAFGVNLYLNFQKQEFCPRFDKG